MSLLASAGAYKFTYAAVRAVPEDDRRSENMPRHGRHHRHARENIRNST